MVLVRVLRGCHTHPIPRGLAEEVRDILNTASFDGAFDLEMKQSIKGTPRTRGIRVVRRLPNGVELKVHPSDGHNKDRRKCVLYSRADVPSDELYVRLRALTAKEEHGGDSTKHDDVDVDGIDHVPIDVDVPEPTGNESLPLDTPTPKSDEYYARVANSVIADEQTLVIFLIALRTHEEQNGTISKFAFQDLILSMIAELKDAPPWIRSNFVRRLMNSGYVDRVVRKGKCRAGGYTVSRKSRDMIARHEQLDAAAHLRSDVPAAELLAIVRGARGRISMIERLRERRDTVCARRAEIEGMIQELSKESDELVTEERELTEEISSLKELEAEFKKIREEFE